MDDRPTVDDAVQFARAVVAQRLPKDRYTSDDLIALARDRGYDFLSSQRLRDWKRFGVFPKARTHERVPGKQGQTGYWTRDDALLLLDLCALHGENVRSQALQLGSWLLGYPLVDDVSAGDLLARQIDRVEEGLFGERPAESSLMSDDEDVESRIDRLIGATTLLSDLCFGLNPALALNPYVDYEDVQENHPDMADGASLKELRHFPYFRQAHNRNLPPVVGSADAAFALYYRAGLPLETQITSDQLAELQKRVLSYWIYQQADTLRSFRQTLLDATAEELELARSITFPMVDRVLRESHLLPIPSRRALAQFLRERRDRRLAFAAPAFFPLTALLIAAILVNIREGYTFISQNDRIALALDQLARLDRNRTTKNDAYLAVAFATLPRQALVYEPPDTR
jgi:hypothetical protein